MSRFELLKAACTFKDTPAKAVWSPPRQPPSRPLVERRYRYDKAGNLISSTDLKSGTTHYRYNPLDRILEAAYVPKNTAQKFAFAPVGNILDDLTQNAREGGLYRPDGTRIAEFNGIEYTYDALGNLIYRQLPNGENQYYQYDLENQLVRAEIKKPAGNTEIWTYAYDPFGRRLSKERKDKLAWTSTDPKRTHFVWDGSRLLQEYTYKGSYEPLAQVFHNNQDKEQYLAYFHNDHIGIPREMTDIHGNLLWYGEYTAWGRLKKDKRVYKNAHQPFRLQNQYYDEETGLHYNLMRYYEAETGRFINQDPIGLLGGENLYQFALNSLTWFDTLGLKVKILTYNHILKPDKVTDVKELKRQIRGQIRAFNKILKIEGLEGLQERIRNSRDDPTIEREEEGTQVIKDLQERVWYGYMNQICVQVVLPRVPIEKGKAEKIR